MIKRILRRFTSLVLVFVIMVVFMPDTAPKAYAEDKPLTWSDKHIELLYNDGEWTVVDGVITGIIEGDTGCESYNTATLTIKNNTTVKAEVSFDYIVEEGDNGGCAEINGEKVSDGKYTAHLNSGESIKMKIKSGNATKTDGVPTTIKIQNLVAVNNNSVKVGFEVAESGNYSVNGERIEAATEYETKVWSIYELEAIPDENEVFLGWYDEDGNCISKEKNYLLEVERNITVRAGFMEKDKGYVYNVCGKAFCTLKDAIAYAEEKDYSFITLLADAVLSEDCIIPKGITLLIPFDDEDTLYKEQPEAVSAGAIATSESEFRRLTLTDGAKLIVDGEISVGGQYKSVAGSNPGHMSGNYGQIMLEQNSKITVRDGGALYAWGFISGEGSVVAEAGSAVYEWYQIMDFRGGSATIGMGNGVFPFSQYSVQNIESTLTLKQGANEFVYAAVFASSKINYSSINFIGENGLFKVVKGSFSKKYDGAADRMNYTIDGTVELNNLNLSLGGMSVSSKSYVLPVTNNTTLDIRSGSKLTVNQDTALLAGTMTNIAEKANLEINSKVYVYDSDEWMAENYACNWKFCSVPYAPSKTFTRKDADITDAGINVNGAITVNGALYTTEGGANIYSGAGTGKYTQASEPGTETVTYQYTQNGRSVTAHEIAITPAKLKIAGESSSFVETANVNAGECFEYADKKWHLYEDTWTSDSQGHWHNCSHENCKATDSYAEHSYEDSVYTWTGDGQTCVAEKDCRVCKHKVTEEGKVTSAVKTEATCTAKGTTTYTATFAGEGFEAQTKEVIDVAAKGHDIKKHEARAATCTGHGWDAYEACTRCDYTMYKEIPATGHTKVVDAAVAPTCTETGLTEGRHCSVCNAVLVAQEVVPAAGHSWSETYTVDTKASCTEKGAESIHCRNCNETKDSREIPATGHIYKDGKCETCGKAKPSSYSGGSAAIVKPNDNIVNKQESQATDKKASTTATIASTSSGNKVVAEIDSTAANKIVEKAVENKSAEIVIEVDTASTATMAEVSISADSIKTITEKTDANLVIKAGENKVDLDKAAVAAVVDKAGSTGTVAFEVETVKNDKNVCSVSFKIVTAAGTITDFGRGTVAVTVTPAKELAAKNIACLYIDEKGIYSKVKGRKNDDGTFTFMAGRF